MRANIEKGGSIPMKNPVRKPCTISPLNAPEMVKKIGPTTAQTSTFRRISFYCRVEILRLVVYLLRSQ
jgi:hypothetical protein